MTIVIPAYNEEAYLPLTLDSVNAARKRLTARWTTDVVVVDDCSDDTTSKVAESLGARVVLGKRRGIGAARNTGAHGASCDLFVFIDADTILPEGTLELVVDLLENYKRRAICIPSTYDTRRLALRPLLAWWRWYAPRHHSTQGVFQAFDSELFRELGGFDESLRMAEDTDLFDRAIAILAEDEWEISTQVRVTASMRRYEQSGIFGLWLLTNPFTTRYFRRYRILWRRWYRSPPR